MNYSAPEDLINDAYKKGLNRALFDYANSLAVVADANEFSLGHTWLKHQYASIWTAYLGSSYDDVPVSIIPVVFQIACVNTLCYTPRQARELWYRLKPMFGFSMLQNIGDLDIKS